MSLLTGSLQWVFAAGLAHVLADGSGDPVTFVAVCGLELPATTPVYSVAPSFDVCRVCERRRVFDVAPPEFPTIPMAPMVF